MGLKQDFRFKYDSEDQVLQFLRKSVSEEESIEIKENNFAIQGRGGSFIVCGQIEPFGIRCDRSGEYFEFLGYFVESLTGEFGPVEIEDI